MDYADARQHSVDALRDRIKRAEEQLDRMKALLDFIVENTDGLDDNKKAEEMLWEFIVGMR